MLLSLNFINLAIPRCGKAKLRAYELFFKNASFKIGGG